MRAAVLRGGQLLVDQVAEPVPGPGQALVETIACGICGSDLHVYQHLDQLLRSSRAIGVPFMFDTERGVVMGHEFSARVLALGPGAGEVAPGDVIVALPAVATPEGMKTVGYSNDYPGGYGERMVLTSALCYKLPDGLDPRHAALTEPMSVGYHAVARAGIEAGEGALVFGCGPVGLAVIASLRLAGAEPIVGADFSPARRRLALRMGAHEAIDPRVEPAIEAWRRLDGQRPLVIFEAVGVPGLLAQAMRDAPQGGRIVVVGVCMEADRVWPMLGIHKELTVLFSLGCRPEEFARTLELIASGDIDVAPLITGEVGIEGVPGAFEALADPEEHAKILVEPALG